MYVSESPESPCQNFCVCVTASPLSSFHGSIHPLTAQESEIFSHFEILRSLASDRQKNRPFFPGGGRTPEFNFPNLYISSLLLPRLFCRNCRRSRGGNFSHPSGEGNRVFYLSGGRRESLDYIIGMDWLQDGGEGRYLLSFFFSLSLPSLSKPCVHVWMRRWLLGLSSSSPPPSRNKLGRTRGFLMSSVPKSS